MKTGKQLVRLLAGTLMGALPLHSMAQDAKMNSYVSTLMQKMTLEEKIGQLNLVSVGFDVTGPIVSQDVDSKIRKGQVGGVFNTFTPNAVRKLQELAVKESRLHIPLLFGYDVIHGHKTIFPIALGIASTWDMGLVEQSARVAATEASADGLNWTYSPMVDIARDPRWGRISEGAGEDPWLGSEVAKAMVKGYQGNGFDGNNTVLSCVKHFALYGGAEAGRDYNTVDMSRIKMYQYYLPPYRAAVDAGAASVMTSFNEVDAVPATANKWLMTDLLRKQWGFKGFVVTDYTAVNEMTAHGIGDLQQVSARALNAGVDMDMVGEGFLTTLKQSLQQGKVSLTAINDACRRILEAKYKLGLFTDPYKYCSEDRAAKEIMSAEHLAAARTVAEHSFVLLKNAQQVLPLQQSGTIALIGPLANNQRDMIGSWSAAGDWKKAVSIATGIKNLVGDKVNVLYAKGANLLDDTAILKQLNANGGEIVADAKSPEALLNEAVSTAKQADVVVAVLGEASGMTGEAACRSNIGIPDNQEALLQALVATGKPVVLVLMNGRPMTLGWENAHVSAILETWFPGIEAGNAVADVLFGKYNPAGRLTATFPRSVGQIPVYYNHKNTGRPYDGKSNEKYKSRYLDIPNDPLFPFGYGLSYTSFTYGDVQLDKQTVTGNQALQASITVTNSGKYAGEEVVQLYISDPVASVTRSVKELKGYQKIMLQPGETKTVTFAVTPELLKFYNSDLQYVWEPGEFIIQIGTNSQDVHSASVNWTK
ncbi:beta-glucosidase BglX [Deminuibacter soli]|uniref:Periplasmic beta-glucosidase n=1 Tax=Deminuibacter soli TaxID=2291815 RepID=A0A3E1NQ64_9BACT|nr:beta-glucosidase BglX [Deminuibacter soli]RFM29938.1 beta-glucosidase BglX [Deminuibacter soli]